jgi:biotin transport system substrate-specific component
VPFVFGIPYMAIILNAVMGLELSFWQLLEAGLFPFILGGVVKAAIAALVIPGAWAAVRAADARKG